MADIFISFIHEEQAVAMALQRLLEMWLAWPKADAAVEVFLSADNISAGEVWLDRIRKEFELARVVILLLTQRSVQRPWVNFEAGAAWLTKKVIIPACFHDLTKDTLPKPYSSIRALDLPADDYYLVESISQHLGRQAPPPPLLSQEQPSPEGIPRLLSPSISALREALRAAILSTSPP